MKLTLGISTISNRPSNTMTMEQRAAHAMVVKRRVLMKFLSAVIQIATGVCILFVTNLCVTSITFNYFHNPLLPAPNGAT